ncbi:MAG: hypothetical protein ACHQ0J_10000 [Candidatus Dormibacterales bacterium]
MRILILRAGATLLSLAAAAASAAYVTSHLKNPSAPLKPPVVSAGGQAGFTALDGRLTIGPSVRAGDVQPVTSTYAS